MILQISGIKAEITDILVDKNEPALFKNLLNRCKKWANKEKIAYITLPIIGKNRTLHAALRSSSFILTKSQNLGHDKQSIYMKFLDKLDSDEQIIRQPFYVKLFGELKAEEEKIVYDASNWYLTGLVLEGL